MATIKLNNGRVILKTTEGNTRVSCSCCGESIPDQCYMYPGDKLNITYSEEDLPTELWMTTYDLWPEDYAILVQRELLTWGPHAPPQGGGLHRVTYQTPPAVPGQFWERQLFNDNAWGALDTGDALFGSLEQNAFDSDIPGLPTIYGAGPGGIYDNFADAYTATCTTDEGTTSKTYYREGLCVWRSRNNNDEVDGALYYRTNASEQEALDFGMGRILWALSGAGFRTQGDGPYNSPAGSYGAGGRCVVVAAE
jgi:hypothetical protein